MAMTNKRRLAWCQAMPKYMEFVDLVSRKYQSIAVESVLTHILKGLKYMADPTASDFNVCYSASLTTARFSMLLAMEPTIQQDKELLDIIEAINAIHLKHFEEQS